MINNRSLITSSDNDAPVPRWPSRSASVQVSSRRVLIIGFPPPRAVIKYTRSNAATATIIIKYILFSAIRADLPRSILRIYLYYTLYIYVYNVYINIYCGYLYTNNRNDMIRRWDLKRMYLNFVYRDVL